MNAIIEELENSLKTQLAELVDSIRSSEESLLRTKEGYLKVQGALEILAILKDKVTTAETDSLTKAIVGPGAD